MHADPDDEEEPLTEEEEAQLCEYEEQAGLYDSPEDDD